MVRNRDLGLRALVRQNENRKVDEAEINGSFRRQRQNPHLQERHHPKINVRQLSVVGHEEIA
eukprot:6191849-Pleurochrysis_carterae.AAC.2